MNSNPNRGSNPQSSTVDQPQSNSWFSWLFAVIGALLALAYLSNPGWGVAEVLPDNIPGLGNIDEVIATTILISCLARLGIRITPNVARTGSPPILLPNEPPKKD